MKIPEFDSSLKGWFGFANCCFAFIILDTIRLTPTEDESKEIGIPLVIIVVFAIIINFILNVVVLFQVVVQLQEKWSVPRGWFVLGFSGSVVWAFLAYENFCGISGHPVFTPCNSFGIGLIIYVCCVYYVVFAFLMSLPRLPSPNYRENQMVADGIINAGRAKINIPDPSFGFYSRQAGAWSFAVIHYLFAIYVLVYYTLKFVIKTADCPDESSVIVLLGLIFNFALQKVLMSAVAKEQLTVCRVWLVLQISGGIVWTFGVYVTCGTCGKEPTSTTCITLAIAAIIYQCYVYYVVLAFTLSLDQQNGMVPGATNAGPVDKQTQTVHAGNLNLTPDGTENAAALPSPDPGALNSQMGNKSQRQDGIPSFII